MSITPTPAQQRILTFITTFQEENGYPPTIRQILAGLGLNSTGSMAWHLRNMTESGLLAPRSSQRECWQVLADVQQQSRIEARPGSRAGHPSAVSVPRPGRTIPASRLHS